MKMKILLGVTAIVAVTAISLTAIDRTEARGPRGAGTVSMSNIQVGPRVTAPVIRPDRIAPQSRPPRQINGPLESGRGINCQYLGWRWEPYHMVGTSRMYQKRVPITRCPTRI